MNELSIEGTGIDLERLVGIQNYNCFSRDFQLVAELKGVWELFKGEEPNLTKPNRKSYGIKEHNITATGEAEIIDKLDQNTLAYIA